MLYYNKYKKYKNKYMELKYKQLGGTKNKYIKSSRILPENKYKGKFEKDDYMRQIKICHNLIKGVQIDNVINEQSILDIGSGRFSDIKYWLTKNIKLFIGIEPSNESIKFAISNIMRNKNEINQKGMKYIIKQGYGQYNWDNIITPNVFDLLNFSWSIHYMLDNIKDLEQLIKNINKYTHIGSKLIISYMDGYKIKEKFKDGIYEVYNNEDKIFHIKKMYDKENIVGSKVSVYLKGTYGLENDIEENLVFDKELFSKLDNFKLIKEVNYIELECAKLLDNNQKKVTDLYKYVILERII
jgi:SAM-dependent methyltransferase